MAGRLVFGKRHNFNNGPGLHGFLGVNRDLQDYLIPVNADIGQVEVIEDLP